MTLETLSMQIALSRLFFIISFASNFLFVTPAAVIGGGAAIYKVQTNGEHEKFSGNLKYLFTVK